MIRINFIRKTLLFAIATACILLSGCQSDTDPNDCYEVEVLGGEPCTLGTLVSIKNSKNIGETIRYSDGKTYSNVVRIYSEVNIPNATRGYIQFREFDQENDRELRDSYAAICLAILAPYPVPTIVATFWSEEPC
jgi:hypothetical protein